MPLATIPSSQTSDGFSDGLGTFYTFGATGFVLRSDKDYSPDAYGCVWTGSSSSPFGSKPAPREITGDRPYSDGQWNGTQNINPKSLTITGDCTAPSNAALNAAEIRMKAAVSHLTFPLYISQAGAEGIVYARQSGESLWTIISPTYATFSIGLTADDPRIYSTQTRQFGPLGFGATGGPDWTSGVNWTSGVDWTESGGGNSATLVNPGSIAVPLSLTLTGPMTTAVITVQQGSTSQSLSLVNATAENGGAILATGQTLTVNTGRHSVLLNGTGVRRSWAKGWPLVPSGPSSVYLTGSGTGSLTGSYVAARY